VIGTYFAIRWAQGDFRLDQNQGQLANETGLLHATSTPKGAEVYIDGNLTSVTDNTVYLAPGEYEIIISKDGYSSWKKTVKVEKALVSQTGATLFPYSPSITSLTFTGLSQPLISPDGHKILYYLHTASAKNKNGLYVLDLSGNNTAPRQISDNDPEFDLAAAQFLWSPDSSEILVATDNRLFSLNTNSFANLQSSPDVTLQLKTILTSWEEEIALREKQYIDKIPLPALQTILANATNFFLSPDKTRLLYEATAPATITDNLIPALPAPNSQPQTRTLEPGNLYIYDSYEDRNYLLGSAVATTSAKILVTDPTGYITKPSTLPPASSRHSLQDSSLATTFDKFRSYYGDSSTHAWQWLPNSTHLVGVVNQQITIISYDGTNPTPIYSGPFQTDFVAPHPSGDSILILTTFNPDSPLNLYAIELKK
jgi:hypothetical protein